ncbi:hypothetical protein [Amycolatopsis acidicola]|nr:hypothetical protein [Amycolatopsis acidicola]
MAGEQAGVGGLVDEKPETESAADDAVVSEAATQVADISRELNERLAR